MLLLRCTMKKIIPFFFCLYILSLSWPASAEEWYPTLSHASPRSGGGQPPTESWGEALPRALPRTAAMAKVSCCVLGSALCCPPSQPTSWSHPWCLPSVVACLCLPPELGGQHEVKSDSMILKVLKVSRNNFKIIIILLKWDKICSSFPHILNLFHRL